MAFSSLLKCVIWPSLSLHYLGVLLPRNLLLCKLMGDMHPCEHLHSHWEHAWLGAAGGAKNWGMLQGCRASGQGHFLEPQGGSGKGPGPGPPQQARSWLGAGCHAAGAGLLLAGLPSSCGRWGAVWEPTGDSPASHHQNKNLPEGTFRTRGRAVDSRPAPLGERTEGG